MEKGRMLGAMIILATNGHAGQFDAQGRPYILHPFAVMYLLDTTDEELQCIALGHDLLEDTKTTYEDLYRAEMSKRVVNGIALLTKMPGQTYEQYKDQVFTSRDSMLVKVADLTHNTDIRRLKGATQKDIDRMAKYHRFYLELKQKLA